MGKQLGSLSETLCIALLQCLSNHLSEDRDWLDENPAEIMDFIEKKDTALLVHLRNSQSTTKKDALMSFRSTVQLKLHEMKDSWLSAWTEDNQSYADKNDMKNFYISLKESYGPTTAGLSRCLSSDETKLISEKGKFLERWTEHFDGVLNRLSSFNDKIFEPMPQVSVNESPDAALTQWGGRSDSYQSIQWQSNPIWRNSCWNR